MSDTTDDFRVMRKDAQERRHARAAINLAALLETTLSFRVVRGGEIVLSPATGRCEVQYWPSTNRWHIIPDIPLTEAAADFLEWLAQRKLAERAKGRQP